MHEEFENFERNQVWVLVPPLTECHPIGTKWVFKNKRSLLTPMSTTMALDADEEGEAMDQKEYHSMIGSLLYLTAMQPDIQFTVCLCARF